MTKESLMRFKCGFHVRPRVIYDLVAQIIASYSFVKSVTVNNFRPYFVNGIVDVEFVIETKVRVPEAIHTLPELIEIEKAILKALVTYRALVPSIENYRFVSFYPPFQLIK